MYRSTLLIWAATLLLGHSPGDCGEFGSLARPSAVRARFDALSSARRATIYTPAYGPTYDGIYTPAYAPPLTRTYVPAYARTPTGARTSFRAANQSKTLTESQTSPAKRTASPDRAEDTPTPNPMRQTNPPATHDTASATIVLDVPAAAVVWINGRKTTSQGTQRKYTSVGLAAGHEYRYRIVVQNGAQQAESEVVLAAGKVKRISISPAAR